MKIKYASYNIRLGIQEGLDAIAEVIAESEADIVALQEVGKNWTMGPPGDTTAYLAQKLGYAFGFFIPAIVEGDAQYGCALLSNIKIGAPKIISLFQDLDEPRKLALFSFQIASKNVNLLTTHLSWIEDRGTQIQTLVKTINELEGLTFLMGDLNEESKVLQEAGLFDLVQDCESYFDQSEERVQDFNGARLSFPAADPRIRIDYICASEGRFTSPRIHKNAKASDHFMISTEWSF